jgi:uncharacterized integral membrane protein
MHAKTFFIILITVLATIVIMQNNESIQLKALLWEFQISKLLLLLCFLVLGIILGLLLTKRPQQERADLRTKK